METRPPIRESIVAIVSGRPMILLAVALVPIFLHHHYFSVSASDVNGYRGLSLTRWNPIVSTRRLVPVRAIESDLPHPTQQVWGKLGNTKNGIHGRPSSPVEQTFPLMLQLPHIILNGQNLLAGNNTALSAVPWLEMLTGLLGNMSLLSYFAKKREKEAAVVQTLGVISTYIVLAQLTIAEIMWSTCFEIAFVALSKMCVSC